MGVIIKQSIKGSIWSYIGAFLGFVNTGLLFPKIFSTSEIGLLSVLVAISALFSQFSSLGMNSVTARLFPYFSSNNKDKYGFLTILVLVTAVGFVLSASVGFVFKEPLIQTAGSDSSLLETYSFYLIPMTFFTLFFNVFDTYNKMLYDITSGIFLKEFVLRVLNFVSIFLFVFGWIDFHLFVLFYVVSYFIPLVGIIILLIKKREFVFSFKDFHVSSQMTREIFLVAAFGILAGFSGIIIDYLDKYLVGKYLGLSHAGVYTTVFFIGGMILLPFRALNKISSTLIAECWKQNDLNMIDDIYKKSSLNQYLFGVFLFSLIILNIPNIFSFLPEQYVIGKWSMIIVAISNVMIMLSGVSYAIISTAKYYWYMTLLMCLQIALVVLCNIIFIPKLGMFGAASASFISVVFIRFGSIFIVGFKSRLWPFTMKHVYATLVTLGVIFISYLLPDLENYVMDAIFKCIIFSVLFFILVIYFNISNEWSNIYNEARKKFIGR